MSIFFSLLVLVLVVLLICWIISLIPVPAGAPPYLKNVLYIIVAIFCICWILDMSGFVDLGVHKHWRR